METKTNTSGQTSYSWDFENRLTSVALPNGGGTVSFNYDPFGRRIRKTGPNGTTIFAYDGANAVEEVSASGTVMARNVQSAGIDEPLAVNQSTLAYYDADGLGSITSLTDSTGTPVGIFMHDAFGNSTGSAGTTTSYRYTARELDSETGLYYYRARYYDPTSGRFLSEDLMRFEAGSDFYTYVGNSPTNWGDPLGLCKKCGVKSLGYDRSGTIPKGTLFHLQAEFLNDSEHDPKCCEIRQFVMWDRPPRPGRSGWPGFNPPEDQPGHWYEDRDWRDGSRYGRRPGGPGDMYSGNSYYGNDAPNGYVSGVTLSFRLGVIDTCNENQLVMMTRVPLRVRF